MAQAKVTLTLTPDEHRIVRLALDAYCWKKYEEGKAASSGRERTSLNEERQKAIKLMEAV